MRRLLLEFQSSGAEQACAQQRAFYAALRTALANAVECADAVKRANVLRSVHKWFTEHLPADGCDVPLPARHSVRVP